MRIFLLTLVACSSLFADDASKNAKIEQFLTLIKANTIEEQAFREVSQQIETVADALAQRAAIPAPERASATQEVKDKMTATMKQYLSWDKLKPGMIKAYSDAYSEAEIDQLLTFFRSPIGQTYITKSRGIEDQTRALAEDQLKAMQSAMQVLTKDWLDKHPAPGSPPAPAPAH